MFQDTAENYGMAGMPNFLRRDDVCTTYERLTGHACRDMDWYTFLAAVRYGVVSLRTGIRGVRFGEAEMPADTDDLLMNRRTLELMLDDAYWSAI
jgi:aminoglycoside phosphotransferase (APT) family kinase protein